MHTIYTLSLRVLLSAAALLCGAGCSERSLPIVHGDYDGGDSLPAGDTGGGDGAAPRTCRGQAPFIRVANAQTLATMAENPEQCLIYGADVTGTEVYFIDTAADVVQRVVAVGAVPTDLTLSADRRRLYVAVFGESKVVVLDAFDGSLIDEVPAAAPPYRIARAPGARLYYVEEDVFSPVHLLNLETDEDLEVTTTSFHEPDLEASADGTALYVGEANQPGSRLLRFDAGDPALPEVDRYRFDGGFTLPSPQRRIFLAEEANRIFFADRSFIADRLTRMQGWLGDQVIAATDDGQILATREFIFDGQTFVRFANRPHAGGGALFSADGAWLYEFDAVGSLLHRTAVATLLGVHVLGETNVPPGSLAQHRLNQLITDPLRPVIYALDAQQNQLLFIDRNLLAPVRAEIIGSSPTDMTLSPSGDEMLIATFGATAIALIDLAAPDKALKAVLPVPGNPFKVALGARGLLVYAEQDQYSDVTLVDFDSGQVLDSLASTVFQPDVEFDPTGRYLFAGESAGPSCRLRKFDLDNDTLLEVGASAGTYAYPARRVIYAGGAVYYAGHKFAADTLAELGDFGEDIVLVTPDAQWAVSRRRVFNTTTFAQVGGLPVDSGLVTADPASELLYQFDNDTGALFVQALPDD